MLNSSTSGSGLILFSPPAPARIYLKGRKMTNEEHRKVRVAAAKELARTGYRKDLEYYMRLRNERTDLVRAVDSERWEICNGRYT